MFLFLSHRLCSAALLLPSYYLPTAFLLPSYCLPTASPQDPGVVSLIRSGAMPKGQVRIITWINHPARWYTPPDQPAYCAVASACIEEDEPIVCYVGELLEDTSDNSANHYTYAIPKCQLPDGEGQTEGVVGLSDKPENGAQSDMTARQCV